MMNRHRRVTLRARQLGAAALLTLTTAGCFEDGALNVDPNRSTTAEPALLFSGAEVKFSLLRVAELTWPVALMNQMWASGAAWGLAQAQYDQTRVRSAWGSIYVDVLKNLKLATVEANARTPKPNNTIAQLMIYQAFVFSQTTYLWGDIPFSEAASGEVDLPKFETQEAVLNGSIKMLDDAIALIDANSIRIGAPNDLYYGGDMTKWRKFANSLKFRILMTMVDADPSKSTAIGAMAAQPMISARADDMKFAYFDSPGRQNPRFSFTQIFRGGVQQDWYASKVMFDEMVPFNDPRLPIYFQPGPSAAPNEFLSLVGVDPRTPKSSLVHLNLLKANLPEVSFSYSEQLLLEAEATARGFWQGGLAAADLRFRAGVRESMGAFGVASTAAETYIAALPTLNATNFRRELNRQQWLDLFMRPLEAWVQWRRSGPAGQEFPAMTVPQGALASALVRRLVYRSEEINSNPNTPSGITLDRALWFDK
ncbi:MAG: SusD/RagB family nutrient-binding outer membrane lipoprotein [Gemmatimonadetes bacterium]|nr:SusD/RagB family nutrient-binding outer membrane lipoprotein [Gemmatimonadota bacterium]MCC6770205.1 SusD/RagB family nutrient-binding outer membrane lipoprotein [Gemmatimonadaceae bacterium]